MPGRAVFRLHAGGEVDYGFDAGPIQNRQMTGPGWTNEVTAEVRAIVPLPDGAWLLGGEFAGFGDFDQPFLARLLPAAPGQSSAVELVLEDSVVDERAGSLKGWVLRRGDATAAASVRVLTEALGGSNPSFEPLDVVLHFPPGERNREVTIGIIDDSVYEPASRFRVVLANPSSGLVIRNPEGWLVVVRQDEADPDFALSIRLEARHVVVGLPADVPYSYAIESSTNMVRWREVGRSPQVHLPLADPALYMRAVRLP
jgi:hypothetical protein